MLAIAAVEGLSGRPGDQGTSFGPFQLHVGGALPRGKGRAWAESPAGIDYALNQIAGVARGLHGQQAIAAISRRFERPANPGAEISKASALYGKVGGGGGIMPPGPGLGGPGPSPPDLTVPRENVLGALLSLRGPRSDIGPLLASMHELRQAEQTPTQTPTPAVPVRGGRLGAGSSLTQLEGLAGQFGLKVTSTTGGKHVEGSYHYQGRAVDAAGNPSRELALMEYALSHPRQFKEAFYDPAGYYVKNGRVYKGSIGGHSDHVHLAR